MKTRNEFTYAKAILYGILTELILVLIQFIYLKNYTTNNPGTDFVFSSEYMLSRGFYVFQIVGFFIYTIVVFGLVRKMKVKTFYKVLVFLITGAILELLFYAIVPADYQFVFFYSILDKFIAGIFGAIVYFYSTDIEQIPG